MTFSEPTTLETYEALCDYARRYSESLDDLRWILGDCANTVTTRYGDKTIEGFARDIGQRKSTLYQYAKVSEFYPPVLRRRILEEMPNINYSHMRDGLRFDQVSKALTWLNEVSSNGWTADEASHRLTERLGNKVQSIANGTVHGYGEFGTYSTITLLIDKNDMEWIIKANQVTIRSK